MAYCHKCGKKIGEDDTFCNNCGYKIKNESSGTNETKSGKSPMKKLFKVITILIIIVVVIGIIILLVINLAYQDYNAGGMTREAICQGQKMECYSNCDTQCNQGLQNINPFCKGNCVGNCDSQYTTCMS